MTYYTKNPELTRWWGVPARTLVLDQWKNVKRESVIEDAQTMTVNKTQKSKDNVEQTRVNRAGNNNRLKERKRLSNELAFSHRKEDEK